MLLLCLLVVTSSGGVAAASSMVGCVSRLFRVRYDVIINFVNKYKNAFFIRSNERSLKRDLFVLFTRVCCTTKQSARVFCLQLTGWCTTVHQ